jgi:hypothetical protein
VPSCSGRSIGASVTLLACAATLPGQAAQAYTSVLSALQRIAPRSDSVATVRGVVLRRDVMEFHLDSGRLYLLTPVAARTVGAVFLGSGSVSFAPPIPVERGQLWHTLGDSSLRAPLTSVVLFFADSTLAELRQRLTFAADAVPPGAQQPVTDALDRLVDGHARSTESSFMTALLNNDVNEFFDAYVKRVAGEDLMFEVDPQADEPILLRRRGRLPRQRTQIVCQFPRRSEVTDTVGPPRPRSTPLAVTEYDIESWIDNGLNFHAQATVHFTARREGIQWTRLLLFEDLQVDSVLEQDGSRDSFFREGGTPELWVRFAAPLRTGQSRTARIVYHGHLIELGSFSPGLLPPWARQNSARLWGLDKWFYIKDTETWYPRTDWQDAAVDLTFHTPARLELASIGKLVATRLDGDVRTTHWVAERPTNQVSFNIGEFTEFNISDARIPPVTVQVNMEAHRRLDALLLQARDPQEVVGADVANSLAFFTQVFGPPLFSRYYATEIPYGHGQAFPGLIHLSWFTFWTFDRNGFNEIFRAHEMAHQWWGIGVEPATYRDTWLSEGFADFSGLWYMQLILRDNQKYFHQLTAWADAIRARGDRAPPLALGTRIAELDPADYPVIVYGKGAWVLQMLRNMMLDLGDKNEGDFTGMMQDFYQLYRGKTASTRDFQRMVEAHTGIPMGWFFDEWVYGTGLPTYTLSWRSDSTAGHPHLLHVRVRQEGVPPGFIMPVPLLIKFGDSSEVFLRINVHGPVTETAIGVPAQPTRLTLNPLQSVLAVVKQEDWH